MEGFIPVGQSGLTGTVPPHTEEETEGMMCPRPDAICLVIRHDPDLQEVTQHATWTYHLGWFSVPCLLFGEKTEMRVFPHQRTGRHLDVKAVGPHVAIEDLSSADLPWLIMLRNAAWDLYQHFHTDGFAYLTQERDSDHLFLEICFKNKEVGIEEPSGTWRICLDLKIDSLKRNHSQ